MHSEGQIKPTSRDEINQNANFSIKFSKKQKNKTKHLLNILTIWGI